MLLLLLRLCLTVGIAFLVGKLAASAKIVQGTIAAAAVINEIIAVIAAKKGFEWAGELGDSHGVCRTAEDQSRSHA